MRQIRARGWFLRLASPAAVVFAFLLALDHPLHAQQATLIVSDLNAGITFFNSTPVQIGSPNPVIGAPHAGGGEGGACLAGATPGAAPTIFVAANDLYIRTYTPNLSTGALGAPTVFATGKPASEFAGLSLNTNGHTLYAADYGADSIWAFSR